MPSTIYIVTRLLDNGGAQVWSGNYYPSKEAADAYIVRQPASDRPKLLAMQLMKSE